MDVPNVFRNEFQLVCYPLSPPSCPRSYPPFHSAQVNIDDGFLNLMTQDGTAKDDVKVPEGDIGKQIQADFDEGKELLVTIVSAMGEEQAISYKEAPKGS